MTLHLKSRGYPFRPRLLFSCFIIVGVGSPNCVLFQERTKSYIPSVKSEITFDANLVLRLRELDVSWERAKPNGKEFFTTFVVQWCGGI